MGQQCGGSQNLPCPQIQAIPRQHIAIGILNGEASQIFREAGKLAYRPPKILTPDLFQNGKTPQESLPLSWGSQTLELLLDIGRCHRFLP
jgi:hypothetical protein